MTKIVPGLRPVWIPFGWVIAAAIAALVILAFAAFGPAGDDPRGGDPATAVAIVVGFVVAGFFVGTRVAAAPVAHGVAIGLFSLFVWFTANLFLGEPTGQAAWTAVDPVTLGSLFLLQIVAAVVGTRAGVRWVRRSRE